MKDNKTLLQHGEVLMVPVSRMPKGKINKVNEQIIAHSETGHHHVVESETAFDVVMDKLDMYLLLNRPAKLVHKKAVDKHKTLTVPKGIWKILHKSEYDPYAQRIQRVID
jgi:hypothetical protein